MKNIRNYFRTKKQKYKIAKEYAQKHIMIELITNCGCSQKICSRVNSINDYVPSHFFTVKIPNKISLSPSPDKKIKIKSCCNKEKRFEFMNHHYSINDVYVDQTEEMMSIVLSTFQYLEVTD